MAGHKKESAVDLAKFIDKGVRVKLAGGREGKLACLRHQQSLCSSTAGVCSEWHPQRLRPPVEHRA